VEDVEDEDIFAKADEERFMYEMREKSRHDYKLTRSGD
jgi:hypothetical protein